jgi:hypothetical protein
MTDFAFAKWGGMRVEASWFFKGEEQFQSAEPKAREPIPVPSDCKKCLLVASVASFSIASFTNLSILPLSGYERIGRNFKYTILHNYIGKIL